MTRAVIPISILYLLFAVPGAAEDIWKVKPVREWSREETQRFLRDSPWVRKVTVGGSPVESLPPTGASVETAAGRRESSGAEGGTSSTTVDVEPGRQIGAAYYVEWSSAKIVRQARLHFAALRGEVKEEGEVATPDAYIVMVSGPDMKAFDASTEAQLAAGTSVRAKRSNLALPPLGVKIRKTPEGRVIAIQFAFSRISNGQPTLSDQEKSVEFACKVRDLAIKTSFNLSKMTTEQGRDL